MKAFEKFIKLMHEYNDLLEEILEIEDDKIHAISEDDMDFLNECVRDEEASMLKMRGLDKQRHSITNEMGCSGKKFKQILEMTAAEERKILQPLFNEISQKTIELRKMGEGIKNMLESKMLINESRIVAKNGQNGKIYGKNGDFLEEHTGMKDTSI